MIKFITLLLIVYSININALTQVTGTFEATQSCPAYLSKNKKTNPDNLMVEVKQSYQLREINKTPPDWLRVEFPEHRHTLRWVSASCGVSEYQGGSSGGCDPNAGMADAHVLALSSQSGFCQTYGFEAGKPECSTLSSTSYQANHLTLHGLWPNQDACGQHYGFCNVKPKKNHCDYSPVNLTPEVGDKLKKLMPSYNYGSCLERHEWNKHGSCQRLSSDEYFSLAMRLTTEMDNTVFGSYLSEHKGETVKLTDLREQISKALGAKNTGKVYLGCKYGILVDIYVVLPALIPFNDSLDTLVNKAPDYQYKDACPEKVTISNFNKDSWY